MIKRKYALIIYVLVVVACISLANPCVFVNAQRDASIFSDSELGFINQNKILKAASVEGGAPLQYFNSKGEITGISIKVLDEISRISGLTFEYTLYETIDDLISSGTDIHFGMAKEFSAEGMVLSDPYIYAEIMICYNGSLDPANLENETFALLKGAAVPDGINPDNVKYFNNREECLDAVNKGKVGYTFSNVYSFAFYSVQNGYKNIVSTPLEVEGRAYTMGIKQGNDILLSIINKSIGKIDPGRIQTIILTVTSQIEKKVTLSAIFEAYGVYLFSILIVLLAAVAYFAHVSSITKKRLENDYKKTKDREERISYLTMYDKLTGLHNRAYFEEKLVELDDPEYYPVSLIIGDIDGLKVLNDVLGHDKGDELLQKTGIALKDACRHNDVVARYGGDEFAVLLPKTTYEQAEKVCERIHTSCHEHFTGVFAASISLGHATKTDDTESMQKVLTDAENMMYHHKLLERNSIRSSIISSLETTLHEKNLETQEHAARIERLTAKMGGKLKLSKADMDNLSLFAKLHDIGKIAVDESILSKRESLSEQDVTEVKKHAEAGYRIAEASQILSGISKYILSHHENWDGTGYPQGLSGEQIPLLSRILTIADAYDTMTHDKPYRKAMTKQEAIDELIRCSGTQFDPNLVPVFIDIIGQ